MLLDSLFNLVLLVQRHTLGLPSFLHHPKSLFETMDFRALQQDESDSSEDESVPQRPIAGPPSEQIPELRAVCDHGKYYDIHP